MRFLILLLLPAACLVAGCQASLPFGGTPTPTATPPPTPTRADEVVIPFETIAVNDMQFDLPQSIGEPAVSTHYNSQPPSTVPVQSSAFLLTSPEDGAAVAEWLAPDALAAVTAVNFEQNAVIVFFANATGGCCDEYIERIATSAPDSLTLYIVERHASSGDAEETLPTHIVLVRRPDLPYALSADVRIDLEMRTEIIGPIEE